MRAYAGVAAMLVKYLCFQAIIVAVLTSSQSSSLVVSSFTPITLCPSERVRILTCKVTDRALTRHRAAGISFAESDKRDSDDDAGIATIIKAALWKVESLGSNARIAKFFSTKDKLTYVDSSKINGAGKGLFAKKDIKRGTIITFYPVHGLGMESLDSSICFALDPVDQTHFDSEETHSGCYKMYIIGSRQLLTVNVNDYFSGCPLFVDVNPYRSVETGRLSHYVNDGASMAGSSNDDVLFYYQQSRAKKNCVHVPFGPAPMLATVATRKIMKGEEIYTTYGASFWNEDFEVTQDVQDEAMLVAKDLMEGVKSIQTSCQSDASMFQRHFDSPE